MGSMQTLVCCQFTPLHDNKLQNTSAHVWNAFSKRTRESSLNRSTTTSLQCPKLSVYLRLFGSVILA